MFLVIWTQLLGRVSFESDICFPGTQIVVAVKKILYAKDANESALEDAQEYLNQSLGVEAEDEGNGEEEEEEEEKTQV